MKRIAAWFAAFIMCLSVFSSCAPGPGKESGDTEAVQTEKRTEALTEPETEAKTGQAQGETEPETEKYDENGTYLYFVNDTYYTVSTGAPRSNGMNEIKTAVPYLYYKLRNADSEVMNNRGKYVLLRDGTEYVLLDTAEHREDRVVLPSDCIYAYIITDTSGNVAGFRVNTELALKYVPLDSEDPRADGYDDISTDSYGGIVFAYSVGEDSDYNIEKTYVLSASDGKLIKTFEGYYGGVGCGDTMYYKRYLDNFFGDAFAEAEMYTSEFVKATDDTARKITVDPDGNLVYVPLNGGEEAGYYIVRSPEGKLSRSQEYKNVLYVWQDYALVVTEDSKLTLIGEDGSVKKEFCDWSDDLMFHHMLSGYHEKPFNSGYPTGLYFIVENLTIPYGTMGSGIEYYYVPETGESGKILTEGVGGYAKPVLYLYPEEECDISVSFEHPELIEISYPEYNGGWNVKARPDGTLTAKDGRSYYALYWEEDAYVPSEFKYGFCVKGEDAASFLEEKLAEIGLTEREADEFIMYWLPQLQRNGVSLVNFELTLSREKFNGLRIDPVPDSLLRVAIHIKKVEKETYIAEQTLPHFERRGFTAVEWGGVAYK